MFIQKKRFSFCLIDSMKTRTELFIFLSIQKKKKKQYLFEIQDLDQSGEKIVPEKLLVERESGKQEMRHSRASN